MTETERLRAELAEARQRIDDMAAAHESFLRGVSHDLRAPLRHVTSYGTLVREVLQELPGQYPQVGEALGFLATMEQSARRMGLMLDGLQAIARAGRAPLRLEAVDLDAAVREARTELAAIEAGRAAGDVQWDIAPHLPAVWADARLLRQLLLQVLGNALKFTHGQPDARLAVQAAPGDVAGRVAVMVQDNGVGFDGARAQHLFGVFQRMHRESEFDGVGAGLALCQAIAQRHGASISAQAAPGAGCTVRLDWPAPPLAAQ
ncbi:ATP-binding protein [Acidovorax sp. SDU_ACID1]|uniref:sensor histidine kinase n=1 Tax=Acidovorax sp. SDU_ACID1 TaxID=3136632 RepID=UPI003872D07B